MLNTESNVTLFLKNGKVLTTKEILFVNDINKALEAFKAGNVNFNAEWLTTLFSEGLEGFEAALKCLSEVRTFKEFPQAVSVYNVEDVDEEDNVIEMGLDEFSRFVEERGVEAVFALEYFVDAEDLTASKEDTEAVLEGVNEDYVKEVYKIIKNDINTYNGIIKKLEYDTPVEKEYYCLYKGAVIKTAERSNCFIDSEEAVLLMCLKNAEAITDAIAE